MPYILTAQYIVIFQSAGRYSLFVSDFANNRISSGGVNLTIHIETFRHIIQRRELTIPSLLNATHYFDNMTSYINLVYIAVKDLADEIIDNLDMEAGFGSVGVLKSSIVICVVLLMCPVLVKIVNTLTNNLQRSAIEVMNKSDELTQTIKEVDSILYQMVPRLVVDGIKNHLDIKPQYFKEVSILCLSVVGIDQLMLKFPPGEVVSSLTKLMSCFEACMEVYDIFRVDTTSDAYVIASGKIYISYSDQIVAA